MSQNLKSSTWKSPSNIALVKYWGKKEMQIPCNSSLSFSLSSSHTVTSVEVTPEGTSSEPGFGFYFEGVRQPSFEPKISEFLRRVKGFLPALSQVFLRISSRNTFPHSSGIASSASSMSALSLALLDLEESISGVKLSKEEFFKRASVMARLGSGSASRSVYGGYTVWGQTNALKDSSDEFAIPINDLVHKNFNDIYDSILIVESGAKAVSSTKGHALMENNPYASARYQIANNNTGILLEILKKGDFEAFSEIVESEAMMLHALMMASKPWFILMQPATIEMIRKIIDFRKQNAVPVCFTLDAGPNIHLLYPQKSRTRVLDFINGELRRYCPEGRWIDDKLGKGPEKLNR